MTPAYDEIEDMARAFMRSRVVLTAVELDIFTCVGQGGATAAEVAARLGADARAAEMLLNALEALGLLEKRGGRFSRGAVAAERLSADSPLDARPIFLHHANLWTAWSGLTDCVRTGRPAPPDETRGDDPARTRAFIGAMHQFAQDQAAAFVGAMDLSGVERVLDLGGGSGAYAIRFAQAKPNLRAVVFDLPSVTELAREYVEEAGLSSRIEIRAGDMLADPLGEGYDLVWASSICHMLGPEQNRALFAKARASLRPGGRLAVRDFIMDEGKASPAFGAVFALNMLVNTENGGTYTQAEYAEWLAGAGFAPPERIRVSGAGHAEILVAKRDGGARP